MDGGGMRWNTKSLSSGLLLDSGVGNNGNGGHALTRDVLAGDGWESIAYGDAPGAVLWDEEDRLISLHSFMSSRPVGDVWVFGYGSLIWNPAIHFAEARTARIDGWHRSFCLTVQAFRGSPDLPGLALALDRGGSCHGTAFRVAEEDLSHELPLLWRREMLCGAYLPEWVQLLDDEGRPFGTALTFTINPDSHKYTKDIDQDGVVQILATARGGLGTNAEYLFRTADGLRARGIPDMELEELARKVRARQAEQAFA